MRLACKRRLPRLMPLTLVADGAEMFVDAEYDQDEFGGDARKDHADDHAGGRGKHQDEPAERTHRHGGEAGENAGDAEQHDQRDHQPVEGLDDGRRDKAVPLKQILKIKHRSFSRQVEYDSRPIWSSMAQGLAPNVVLGKQDRTDRAGQVSAPKGGWLEIAANNGHNRASFL